MFVLYGIKVIEVMVPYRGYVYDNSCNYDTTNLEFREIIATFDNKDDADDYLEKMHYSSQKGFVTKDSFYKNVEIVEVPHNPR